MSTMKLKSPPKTVTANCSTPPEALVAMAWKLEKKLEYWALVAAMPEALAGKYWPTNVLNCPIWVKNTGTKR